MNISSGGPGWNGTVRDAVNYAYNKGALPVASAGNDDRYSGDYYPAGYANAMGVTSTNRYDQVAGDANRGPHVAVAAPGVSIFSTVPNGYATYSGTSQAAPLVTGLAGLIASEGVSTSAGVRNRILSTARDLGPAGYDHTFGYGRVNFAAAVR